MPFQYKRTLLIGATSGIGAAMADKLIAEGSKVIAVGRRQERLDDFVAKHGAEKASGVKFDVTDAAGTDAFVEKIASSYPDLDCVFVNAGTQDRYILSDPASVDMKAFFEEFNLNFTCAVNLIMKFLPKLQAKKGTNSGIIVTNSHLSLIPAVTMPAYSASKAALHAFVNCLQAQLSGSNVKVVDLWPPIVQSELHDYMGVEVGRALGMPVDAFVDEAYAGIAAGEELVLVGRAAGDPAETRDIVKRRQAITDQVTKFLMARK